MNWRVRAFAGFQTETADNYPALFGTEVGEKIIYQLVEILFHI